MFSASKRFLLQCIVLVFPPILAAQYGERFDQFRQQMEVWINDTTFRYWGNGTTQFINRSGDTLTVLFYHLYFNAFQPGSAMHQRAKDIHSPLARRIEQLKPSEYGRLEMQNVIVNGRPAHVHRFGTIARITPATPILPNDSVVVHFRFSGQIPRLVRRAGHSNAQGIRYSMAQWYPKLCQYDQQGWHNNQYVGREFFGVFGTYDVILHLPARYTVGATGQLQNPLQVGHGYQFQHDTLLLHPSAKTTDSLLRWHFIATGVHDFAWVADDQYAHQIVHLDSLRIHILFKHYLYRHWQPVAQWIKRTFQFFNQRYSPYPYRQFTCAQAGDGGMEYPQLIMITHRPPQSLLSVLVHEIGHQWFYGIVANNETKHAWMDEGFTTFITYRALFEEFADQFYRQKPWWQRWFIASLPLGTRLNLSHLRVAHSGFEEPLTTPHDRFRDAFTARQVYSKGAVLLRQLQYCFGTAAVDSLLRYYVQRWRFRHPYPADFEKVCEQFFQQRLDAFFDTFIRDTELPNYGFSALTDSLTAEGFWQTTIELYKSNRAHQPLRLLVYTEDNRWHTFYIPVDIPYYSQSHWLQPWFWTNPRYTATIQTPSRVAEVLLDTTGMLIDAYAGDNRIRNRWLLPRFPAVRFALLQRFEPAQPLPYYGISLRPSIGYHSESGWQFGIRSDGFIDFERYRTTLGVYYNLGSRRWDWQFRFSYPLRLLGGRGKISRAIAQLDGAQFGQFHVNGTIHPEHYMHPLRIHYLIGGEFWQFDPPSNRRSAVLPMDERFYRLLLIFQLSTSDWRWTTLSSLGLTDQPFAIQRWQPGIRVTSQLQWTFRHWPFSFQLRIAGSSNIGTINQWDRIAPHRPSTIEQFRVPFYRFWRFLPDLDSSLSPFLPGLLPLTPSFTTGWPDHFVGISFLEQIPLSVLMPSPLSHWSLFQSLEGNPYLTFLSWYHYRGSQEQWQFGGELGIDFVLNLERLFPFLPWLLPVDSGPLTFRLRASIVQWHPQQGIDLFVSRKVWLGISALVFDIAAASQF